MTRIRPKTILFGIVLCLALGLVAQGCGSSDGSDSNAASGASTQGEQAALTKAEYVKQADKICRDAVAERTEAFLAKFRALRSEGKQMTPQVEAKAVEEIFVPTMSTMVDELEALEPPAAQAEELEAIVASYRDSVELAEEDPENALPPGLFEEPAELARDFGFQWCAEL